MEQRLGYFTPADSAGTVADGQAKPGWKTTEFWLTLVVFALGAVMSSGAFTEDSAVAGWVGGALSLLSILGYGTGRAWVKGKTAAAVATAATAPPAPTPPAPPTAG